MSFLRITALLALIVAAQSLQAQTPLITRNSTTTFFSHAPLEDIEAINNRTTAALDLEKGEIVVKMLIQHFEFENALMQEHFNENYMESEQFPAAIFKGSFSSERPIDLNTAGEYALTVSGDMTIHGVTKTVDCQATFVVDADGKVVASTELVLRPNDFDIAIPSVVVSNIAEEIEVKSTLTF